MDRKRNVAIVVDSAASLPGDASERPALHIVPMRLVLEGRTYLDGRDLEPTAFYRMLKGLRELPTTSAPPPASFLDAFRVAAQEASSILCLTASPRFSSSHDSARTAAQEAKDALPGVEIVVLDTESAAGGEGLIAMEAWRTAQRDASLEEVVAAVRGVVARVSLLAILDTLYYVWKGGRIPGLAYAATSLIGIKPLLEMRRGEVRNVARPRTRPKAEERMLELMRQQVPTGPLHATVMHAYAAEDAESLKRRLEFEFEVAELFVSEFSPVIGAHTGPGLLAVAFWSEGQPG